LSSTIQTTPRNCSIKQLRQQNEAHHTEIHEKITKHNQTLMITDENEQKMDLEDVKDQSPDGVDHEDENADRIGYAVSLGERVSEPTGGSNVLLKEVAAYD